MIPGSWVIITPETKEAGLMTWEEKFAALGALSECRLAMRKPGDWYVSQSLSIGGDGLLRSFYGNGDTPEDAVNEHWEIYTGSLHPNNYVVANGNGERERRVRWNGYMWHLF